MGHAAPPPAGRRLAPTDDTGAQALEFSLVIPAMLAMAMIVAIIGQAVLGVAGTHHLAVTAARTAAVHHDDRVQAVAAGDDVVDVHISPPSGSRRPGDLVTVTVTRTIPLGVGGHGIDVSARATYRTEDLP